MAKGIENYPNIEAASADYPNGRIKDKPNGTPVNQEVYSDLHMLLDKLLRLAGVVANDTPENETNGYQYVEALQKLFVQTVPGSQLKTKVVEIGDWDMDTDTSINVAHGIADYTKIRAIDVIVRKDTPGVAGYNKLESIDSGGLNGGIFGINTTNLTLYRSVGGTFDDPTYSTTSYNRGWITITYDAS